MDRRLGELIVGGAAPIARRDYGRFPDAALELSLERRHRDNTIAVHDVPGPITGWLEPVSQVPDDKSAVAWTPERRQPLALVVDAERLVGSLICRLLLRHGWRSIVASDGESALAETRRSAIELLVTDYELPGISGLTLAARLRERDPDLPVLVVSGWPDAADLVKGLRFAFVQKPFRVDELMAGIQALTS